jgi:hypothetical protein
MLRRFFWILLALGIAAAAATPAWAAGLANAPAATSVFTIYLAPASKGGSDHHTGLSRSSPILTLAQAQRVLEQHKPTVNVEVRIEQGTYVAPQTRWTFYVPGHTISFLPINYVYGHGRPPGGDPVFVDTTSGSGHTAGWWFQAQEPSSGPLHDGGTAGLRFYYLQPEDYTNGISFDGQTGHASQNDENPPMYIKPSAGLNGNSVSGMTFLDIGDLYAPGQTGFGAILLTDSSDNWIDNNTFDHIENSGSSIGQIHGIYVTHFSSSNTIDANKFVTISSYAIKVRDRSDDNTVDHNTFNNTGGTSAYRDEFCDLACAKANPGTARQCASYGNSFFYNTIGTVFDSSAEQGVWSLSPAGLTYAGGSGCSIPRGQQRLRTGGNT